MDRWIMLNSVFTTNVVASAFDSANIKLQLLYLSFGYLHANISNMSFFPFID